MMTEKQEQFIDSLMKKKEYEPNDTLIQAHRSGMDLSKSDASRLIDYLLACDDVKKDERPLGTLIDMTKSALYRTIKNKKSKKNEKLLAEIKEQVGIQFWYKGQEQEVDESNVETIATILSVIKKIGG